MRTISIDFASHDGHIACVDGSVRSLRSVERANDAGMIALLEDVLREAGWKKEGIERIACNLGPGGFTSVRGGVAFANALADQLQVSLAGYHGSSLALARCHADLWTHSTKADALFVLGDGWKEPTLVVTGDLPAAIGTATGDQTEAHRALLASKGAAFPAPSPLQTTLPAFLDGLSYGKDLLVPWYGRGI